MTLQRHSLDGLRRPPAAGAREILDREQADDRHLADELRETLEDLFTTVIVSDFNAGTVIEPRSQRAVSIPSVSSARASS